MKSALQVVVDRGITAHYLNLYQLVQVVCKTSITIYLLHLHFQSFSAVPFIKLQPQKN